MITEENVMENENMITGIAGNTEENKNNRGDDLKKADPGEKPLESPSVVKNAAVEKAMPEDTAQTDPSNLSSVSSHPEAYTVSSNPTGLVTIVSAGKISGKTKGGKRKRPKKTGAAKKENSTGADGKTDKDTTTIPAASGTREEKAKGTGSKTEGDLKKLTAYWMQLERKTLEQRRTAARFYDEYLMKPIEDEYINNNRRMVFEEVEHMVVSVGTSYEPIVLNIQLLRPDKILFLYTDRSESTMVKVIEYCGLGPARYDKSLVSEVDPMDIYREIKAFYLRSGKPGRMYIDFTGGTKAMSAAAALAGAMINVQMIYCSTDDYLVDFRKPNPGSERLMYIENPLAVFGELEIEKAFELFDKHNFAGAKEKFSVLKESIPEPALRQQLGFVCLLAGAYEAWDALDFIPAYEKMLQLQKEIERDRKLHRDFLLMDYSLHIDRQRSMLEHLSKIPAFQEERNMPAILGDADILHALAMTIYQNAKTREEQEKYDMATLLLYRLLEMMSQRRLSEYGIFPSRPDYQHARFNIDRFPELRQMSADERFRWLVDRYKNISEAVFRREPDRGLPSPIASLDGFILLATMGDPLVGDRIADAISMIKRIRSMVYLRNNSIFAHGLGPVSHRDFARFRTFVFDMFRSFCDIEKIDFEDSQQYIDWINPMHSANYSRSIN